MLSCCVGLILQWFILLLFLCFLCFLLLLLLMANKVVCVCYQYVHFNGHSSSRLPITCGVPQGSILGPLSFLIYIYDICHVAKMSRLILFANDTNIFVANHNLNNLIWNINYELQLTSEWFQVNKLSLNVSKTNFVFFVSPNNVMIITSW